MNLPTTEDLRRYADDQKLRLTAAEIDEELARTTAALTILAGLDGLEERPSQNRYPRRDPGREPSEAEDPYHAIIRFCEVEGAESGPLAGMRIGVKDNIAVAGVPMTGGERRDQPVVPVEDAVVVERLLDAGATIVAKTNINLDEEPPFGLTRNPLDPRFSAGGSSSGSAAAVAAGIADAALGVDQGGSIRMPASWCGIVGMKATHGLVPSYGLIYWDHTLDHIGPMTRTVVENALLLSVIAGGDWRDPQWVRADPVAGDYTGAAGVGIEGLRVGVVTECLELADCSVGTLAAFERAQATLRSLGAEVFPVSVPLWADAPAIWLGVVTYGLNVMADCFGQGHGHLGRIDMDRMAATACRQRSEGRQLPAFPFGSRAMAFAFQHVRETASGVPFGRAHNLRLELRRQIDDALAVADVLITPTARTGPVEMAALRPADESLEARLARGVSEFAKGMSTTCPANLTGHPALTLPSGAGDNDLPSGLQIIGRRFDEHTVYRAGFAFEAAQASRGAGPRSATSCRSADAVAEERRRKRRADPPRGD